MFVSYIQGVRNHWSGNACIAHYTSKKIYGTGNMQENHRSTPISSILPYTGLPDGTWKMWYKDQNRGSVTMMAESKNLKNGLPTISRQLEGMPMKAPKYSVSAIITG